LSLLQERSCGNIITTPEKETLNLVLNHFSLWDWVDDILDPFQPQLTLLHSDMLTLAFRGSENNFFHHLSINVWS